jgi:RNA polymerase sigma-70 factor (ECF subfamily)
VNTTRTTLIGRIRDREDSAAWQQFFALYAPILLGFARSRGLGHDAAEEVRDACLEIVSRRMPGFRYDRSRGGFKAWLYRIAHGKIVDHLRRKRELQADSVVLASLASAGPTPDEEWERSWRQEHLRYCLDRARGEVSERGYRAFDLLLVHGKTVPEVCQELDCTPNQVYKAKMRVLARVRRHLERLDGTP